LLGRIIEVSSNVGEVVLDPFAGSGSTLIVAKKLGRRYLGFELSESYHQKVCARLDAVKAGQALDGVLDPKTSAPSTSNGKRLDRRPLARIRDHLRQPLGRFSRRYSLAQDHVEIAELQHGAAAPIDARRVARDRVRHGADAPREVAGILFLEHQARRKVQKVN